MADSKFWNSPQMEPKRQNKFILSLRNIKHFVVKNVKRPSFEVGEDTHAYFNYDFKYPGRVTWNDVDVTLVEPISHNSVERIRDAINDAGYGPMVDGFNFRNANGEIDKETFSKAKSSNALGIVTLEHVDAEGSTIDRWELHNAWIKNADFSELNYEESGLSEVTLTFAYDWASVDSQEKRSGFEGGFIS